MPSLDQHQSGEFFRILYLGNSGAGKTGSLVSLVPDYDLRIIDTDNGLDPLVNFTKEQFPDRLSSIQFLTIRDKYKSGPTGLMVDGLPKAFVQMTKVLDKWPDDQSTPSEWGPKKILVIDSLTSLGNAAFEWARAQNPTYKEKRLWFGDAQKALENFIAVLTSESFRTNVIVCTHIDRDEETKKGFASAVGKALGPKLPRYFNTMISAESVPLGRTSRRTIRTVATAELDLKNPAPMRIEAEYPLETGMATLVKKLKGN